MFESTHVYTRTQTPRPFLFFFLPPTRNHTHTTQTPPYLPEFSTNLVAALAALNVNNFPHLFLLLFPLDHTGFLRVFTELLLPVVRPVCRRFPRPWGTQFKAALRFDFHSIDARIKIQQHRERTYSKSSKTERRVIQNPATQRDELFTIQQDRERRYSKSSNTERGRTQNPATQREKDVFKIQQHREQ